jgi:hypothetical protein
LDSRDGSMSEIHRRQSVFHPRPQGSAMGVRAPDGVFVSFVLPNAKNWHLDGQFEGSNPRITSSGPVSSLG